MYLLAEATGTLSDYIQTGSVVTILAGFLWYFMKELKEVRMQSEALRATYEASVADLQKKYDDKFGALLERMFQLEKSNLQTLNDVKDSNDRLNTSITTLIQKIDK